MPLPFNYMRFIRYRMIASLSNRPDTIFSQPKGYREGRIVQIVQMKIELHSQSKFLSATVNSVNLNRALANDVYILAKLNKYFDSQGLERISWVRITNSSLCTT